MPVESVGVKVGVPTKGLCFAVTVTSSPGTVKELFSVVGLLSVTFEEVHSLKGMSVPSELFFSLGLMLTVSFSRNFPLYFVALGTPGPVNVPSSTVTVRGVPKR